YHRAFCVVLSGEGGFATRREARRTPLRRCATRGFESPSCILRCSKRRGGDSLRGARRVAAPCVAARRGGSNPRRAFCVVLSGEGGIRTPDAVTRIRHFQCRSFSLSDTSPYGPRAVGC